MLTGERSRPVSARRGMTVLGKIPAVPKPVNLPSQRLENRGLDPNVELVPRGSVSWGAAGRSPPTSTSPWANSTQSSSPPVGGGPWGGAPPRPSTAGSSGPAAIGSSGPATASTGGPWGGNASRPSSAGSVARPSSAGSLRQTQEALAAANAWGPATTRPSSASGVLGQAQSQPPAIRPRSAETRTLSVQAPALTRFADQTNGSTSPPPPPAWGGAGAARKLSEEPHQPARFTLTRVDFPTLGSEKNPDLRPQQNKTGSSPTEHTSMDERVPPTEDHLPPGPTGPYEELPPTYTGAYGGQERMAEGWRRDARPYGGHPGMAEGNWHRDGPPPMQPYGGGQPQGADTWRRESGHGAAPGGGPSDDNWRRGGPPVGPYGPPAPGRFQPDPTGFMHQQRYGPGPGPGPYGSAGGSGPGVYGRHGDMYGNAAPFARPGGVALPRPGPPMGPGIYQGPVPYDNYYGPPGPGYGSMDEREMMMLGMNGPPGMYGNFPQGPPVEPFGRYSHGGPGPGHRHNPPPNSGINRERMESMGYEEGYREGDKYKDNSSLKDGGGYKEGGGFSKEGGIYKEGGCAPASYQDTGENRRGGNFMVNSLTNETQRPSSRGGHGGHRDWGAAASSDEPMDFSKPVFEEDVSSASPVPLNKQPTSLSCVDSDTIGKGGETFPAEHLKIQKSIEDVGFPSDKMKGLAISGEPSDTLVVPPPKLNDVSKDDHVQLWKPKESDPSGPISKSRGEDISNLDTKDQVLRKVLPMEISESSEKRWTKDVRISEPAPRERGFGRETVFSPHGGRAVGTKKEGNPSTGTLPAPLVTPGRSGQYISGSGANNRPTVVSVSQGPISSSPEPVLTEEVVSPSVQEKNANSYPHASSPTSPSGSDGQKISDKLRILKRVGDGPDCPPGVSVNTTEASITEALVTAVIAIEPVVKDDSKPKSKSVNSHDGEKEWRPKVTLLDTAVEVSRSSSTAVLKQVTTPAGSASPAVVPAATLIVTEKPGLDVGNATGAESYDYEAQRARMKEIAAQRAIQLRKEEEERIKEQKAKALAKLEELNRRSSVVSVSQPAEQPALEEATEEPESSTIQLEEIEVLSEEVVVEEVHMIENSSIGTGANTPRGTARKGASATRKRKTKNNGRNNKQKLEGSTVSADCTFLEPNQGWNIDLSSSNDSGTEVGKSAPQTVVQSGVDDSVNAPPSSVPQKDLVTPELKPESSAQEQSGSVESAGSLVGSFRSNSDVPNKKPQRKSQPTRRVPARDRGTSQDVRVGDKPHGGEGMIWAPVRSPSGAHPAVSKGGFGSDSMATGDITGEKKEDIVVAPQVGRARRAELERYTPKPVVKQQAQQQEEILQQQAAPLVVQHQGNESSNVAVATEVLQNLSSLSEVKFGSEGRQIDNNTKPGRAHASWRQRGSGNERVSTQKETHHVHHPESAETGGKSQQQSYNNPTLQAVHRSRPLPNAPSEQSRPGSSHQVRSDIGQATRQQTSTPMTEKEQQNTEVSQQGRSAHSNVPAMAPIVIEKELKIYQEGVTPYQPPRPGSSQKNRGIEGDVQTSNDQVRSHRANAPQVDRPHGASGKFERENHGLHERGVAHPQSRPQNFRHQGPPVSQDRELPVSQQGSHQQPRSAATAQSGPSEGTSISKEHQNSHTFGATHTRPASQSLHGQHYAPVLTDREQSLAEHAGAHHLPRSPPRQRHRQQAVSHEREQSAPGALVQPSHPEGALISKEHQNSHAFGVAHARSASQPLHAQQHHLTDRDPSHTEHAGAHQLPRSPVRQRNRQQAISHEREQTTAGAHTHQQPRYRQPVNERDHQRDVANAVHQQQQQRGPSDGHWQQTASVLPERSSDHGQSYEHSSRSISHKLQTSTSSSVDRDHSSAHPGSHQHSRLDSQNKPQAPVASDPQKQPQYQPVSHHQKSQQSGTQGPKTDNAHNSSRWNGERGASPPALRGREHGHSRRGRFGGRPAGSLGRGGEIENRREQLPKQRLPIEAGGAVPSQVGG